MWLRPQIRLLRLQSKSSYCKAPTLHIVYQHQLEGAPTPRFCSTYCKEHQLLLPSTQLIDLQRLNKNKSIISQDPEWSSSLTFAYPFSLKHALFYFLVIRFSLLKMYIFFFSTTTSTTRIDSYKFIFIPPSK